MTPLHLLALAGYFLLLAEYIAMRHRDICAESDARMDFALWHRDMIASYEINGDFWEAIEAQILYLNRGTK